MSSPFIIIDEIGSLITNGTNTINNKIGAGNASAHGTTYATTDTLFGRIRFIADTLIGTNKTATGNKDGNIMEKLNYLSSNIPNVSALTNSTYGLDKIQALVATNNNASTTGILSQKLSSIINTIGSNTGMVHIIKSDTTRVALISEEKIVYYDSSSLTIGPFKVTLGGYYRIKAVIRSSNGSKAYLNMRIYSPISGNTADNTIASSTITTNVTVNYDVYLFAGDNVTFTLSKMSSGYGYLNSLTVCFDQTNSIDNIFQNV